MRVFPWKSSVFETKVNGKEFVLETKCTENNVYKRPGV